MTEVAYLKPIRSEKSYYNYNSLVTKLLFDGKTCIGVKVKNKNKINEFFAERSYFMRWSYKFTNIRVIWN